MIEHIIGEGDVVQVRFQAANVTLGHRLMVEHIPCATGDSWRFYDLETNRVYYVSEGCTVIKTYEY